VSIGRAAVDAAAGAQNHRAVCGHGGAPAWLQVSHLRGFAMARKPFLALLIGTLLPLQAVAQRVAVPETDAVHVLVEVLRHLLIEADSLPRIGRPSPGTLASRLRGDAAVAIVSWPSALHDRADLPERLPDVANSLRAALREADLNINVVERTEQLVSPAERGRVLGFGTADTQGAAVMWCETAAGPGPVRWKCQFAPGVVMGLHVGYPVARGEDISVPVFLYTAEEDEYGSQQHWGMSVLVTRDEARWRVRAVVRPILIST
jgi:hypothetical protein